LNDEYLNSTIYIENINNSENINLSAKKQRRISKKEKKKIKTSLYQFEKTLSDENRYSENNADEDLKKYEKNDIDESFIIFKSDLADNNNNNKNDNLIIVPLSKISLNNNTVRELRKKY
jgi:hypothetical protein